MPDIWMDVDAALSEVPVNVMPLIDDTDFKTVEDAIAYNAAGMDLRWNFVTTAGAYTSTAVTPTTSGDYDWTHQGDGMYSIEIPASGGASINNDTEGFGWFSGKITGVLPWRGPVIGFRAAALNNALIDSAWSTTRGLAGTALPDAAADAAGGLIVSDAGGLDADAQLADIASAFGTVNYALATIAAYIDTEVAAIKAKTDNLPATPASTSDIPSAATNAAAVRTELATELARIDAATSTRASQTSVDDLPTNADLATALGTADDAVLAAIAALSIPTTGQITTAVLTTAMTEAYRSTGATGTVAQLLYEILGNLTEFANVGTTRTVRKLDGATPAKTYTYDSANNPTNITEAT